MGMFKQISLCLLWCVTLVFARENIQIDGTNREYRPEDWTSYTTTRFVKSVAIGHENIFFATTGGITKYNFFSNQWQSPITMSDGLGNNHVLLVAFDFNTGYLWAATTECISYMEPATQYWTNIYYDRLGLSLTDYIVSIGIGNDQQVYLVSALDDMFVSNNLSIMFTRERPGSPDASVRWYGKNAPAPAPLPHLFMDNAYMFDENDLTIEDTQLRSFDITCWAFDEWNNIWIGTWGLGAAKASTTSMRLELLPFGLWQPSVDAIELYNDQFWIGGIPANLDSAGLTHWDISRGEPKYFEPYLITGFNNSEITSIIQDDSYVWVGTRHGVTYLSNRTNRWRTFTIVDNLVDDWIHDLAADSAFVYVATAAGVSRIKKQTVGTDSVSINHVLYPQLRNISTYDLEFQANLLWMATEYGIFIYDTEQDSGGFYTGTAGPANQETFAVSVFQNEVWFGTEEGVSAFDVKTREWLPPPARRYEINANINRIFADEKAVWVATNQGVFKYNKRSQHWRQYTIRDGLISNSVYSLYPDDDYIWFGTNLGLTRFYWDAPYRID